MGKHQSGNEDLRLSEEELSEDAVQHLKSELPKALTGSIDDIKKLIQTRTALETKIDYNTPGFDGYSSTDIPLLHIAAAYGPPEIVEFLLDAGANIEETTDAGSTVLHLAARNGCHENLKILFDRGAKSLIDVPMHDRSLPLTEGVWGGDFETCRLLVALDANLDLKGSQGRTALMFGAKKGYTEIIKLLLDAGADIHAVSDDRTTALNYAVERNFCEATKLLLTRGADKTLQDGNDGNVLHVAALLGHADVTTELLLDPQDSYVNSSNSHGNTALHLAAFHGQPHIAQILIEHHADKEFLNKVLDTPLHVACATPRPEVARVLIQNGAQVDKYNENGNTPLQLAAASGEADIVSILLDRHAKVDTNNKNGNTPLQLASADGHHEVVRILLDHNAAVCTRTLKNGSTSLHLASDNGHTEVISLLLAHKADLAEVNKSGFTPLHLACDGGHVDAVGLLLDSGTAIAVGDTTGMTPLHAAAFGGHVEIVELLLERGADVNCVDAAGDTPLHIALSQERTAVMDFLISQGADIHKRNVIKRSPFKLACAAPDIVPFAPVLKSHPGLLRTNANGWSVLHYASFEGRDSTVQELLEDGQIDPSFRTLAKRSPLRLAVENNHVDVVLNLLNSQQYYPDEPIWCQPCPTAEDEIQVVAEGLKRVIDMMGLDERDRAKCILYWAIANCQPVLIEELFSRWFNKTTRLKGGMTCLHVAAQYGHKNLIAEQFSGMSILDITHDGITSFQVATASGHLDVMEALLDSIQANPAQQIQAIIMLASGRESALSLAVKGRDPDVKGFLWARLKSLALEKRDFYSTNKDQADQLLELAAQLEKPGDEIHLQMMLDNWFERPKLGHSDTTVLHSAIENHQVVVLWWLLANGGHFKKDEMDFAHKILDKKGDELSRVMIDLLQNPPQIVEQDAITDSDRPPARPKMPSVLSTLKKLPVTIIDFYDKENNIDLHYTERSIEEIIYDPNSGPNEVMQSARRKGHRQLKSLKQDLAYIKETSLGQIPAENMSHDDMDHANLDPQTDLGNLRFRWLHVPANHMQLTTDLATVISIEQGRMQKEHLHAAKFFSRNYGRVAAGQNKTYMKPQCTQEFAAFTEQYHSEEGLSALPQRNRLALYMPFLSLGKLIPEHNSPAQPISQDPMTLDQYFYPTIEDTSKRDNDQVVSRYLERAKMHADENVDDRNEKARSQGSPSTEVGQKTILMVDQVWMWILDGCMGVLQNLLISWFELTKTGTIITTSSKPPDQREDLLSAGIRDFVMSNQSQSSFERVTSMNSMIEVVLGVATGLFTKRIIQIQNGLTEKKPERKSALEIFRESIRRVANLETDLFRDFMDSLDNEKKNHPHRYAKGWVNNMPENPYHVISEEARLLDEIKDIQDELNMLRTLAESQQNVWEQAFQTKELNSFTHFQFKTTCTPNMILRDIQDMITEAKIVQESINTLLDLRQKQASIKEAEFGRQQANDTAKQANIVMVFTLVTIVFLPLSFLSSVFALNVRDFPHSSGVVEYQAYWIFPILFCVSAGVSIPFMILAFNFDRAIGLWNWIKYIAGQNREDGSTDTPKHSQSDGMQGEAVDTTRSSSLDKDIDLPKNTSRLRKYGFRRHEPSQSPC
ncbi:Mg2+ transporter protein CorA-like/Zinc transport protein ZntB [Penicillium verhagenii]|nr:Mg2+ transporter protein CorA-like/Zinc transport protein ZntB [Penicillium verhagenii]